MPSKKPGAPNTKSPSPSEQNQQVEQQLSRYNCTLDKDLSAKARQQGLVEGKTVCSLVNIAVEEYIKKAQEKNKINS